MNGLSWLIYLSDVTDALSKLLGIIGGFGFLASGLAYLVFYGISFEKKLEEKERADTLQLKRFCAIIFSITITMLICSAILPSRQTMLMIAASEFSERTIKSGPAQEIINELQKVIVKKLQDASK